MYLATIKPSKITVRYEPAQLSVTSRLNNKKYADRSIQNANLKVKKSSFGLSYQSKRKLQDSIQLLHELSAARTVSTPGGKEIYNFRSSFITLTLPSAQCHPDQALKGCLNNLLTTLRTTYGVSNYVWKAELQGNQNIHFHLILDQFIPHQAIRYYWNKAINTLGYVDRYRERFAEMSLSQYATYRNQGISDVKAAFAYGQKHNWSTPGTEQVISLHSRGQVQNYLSKYLSKPIEKIKSKTSENLEKTKIGIAELARIKAFGRVWGRSHSLSQIVIPTRWNWESVCIFIQSVDKNMISFDKRVYDYCTVYYLKYKGALDSVKSWIRSIIVDIGRSYDYPFPISV